MSPRVAIVHDYLTQRGGAERVVLALARAFPDAPVYTSLYDPLGTFPEFAALDVRPSALNRFGALRHDHRRALVALRSTFGRLHIDADVLVCSSSGWAHGATTTGRKIVYCHSPARWLYAREQYLPRRGAPAARLAVGLLGRGLRRWDAAAAASADCYLTNSTMIRDRVRAAYGIEARIVPPPAAVDATGALEAVPGIEPGFVLCVSRLLPYKHVAEAAAAFARLPQQRLVVVGRGPQARAVRRAAGPNVTVLEHVSDRELRWLYAQSVGLLAASHEDFGLTPIEAASFGKPVAALRYGGFLDTVVPGVTGVFFDAATPAAIAAGVEALLGAQWEPARLVEHAHHYSEERFAAAMRSVVAAELPADSPAG